MALTIGTQLGSHEITALLGKGGMGEVYRARDTRLKREVAIKILPSEFSGDADRLGRFQREAELLASLNHPNIAGIYDFQEANGSRYLVLELVEGETLADRIARGALPIEEALVIGTHICDALEAAHEKGVVHRDLKPANIKLTPEGKVKVLDFGLAKAFFKDEPSQLSNSPTVVTAASMPGVILGTVAYMSPEQAKGRDADARSDVWSFGCVLYEMLAGKPAFTGETVLEVLSATLRGEPDWKALPQGTPAAIHSLLKRCLQKDRNKRLRAIGHAALLIEEAQTAPAIEGAPILPARPAKPARFVWPAAIVVLLAVLIAVLVVRPKVPNAPEMRLQIPTPDAGDLFSFAISPDGRKLVYAAGRQLWLRPLESETAQLLPQTEGAAEPFWSPDGKAIAFFAGRQVKRIDLASGAVQALASAPTGDRGGTWSSTGVILFAQGNGPLLRVPAGGGTASDATHLTPQMTAHRFPKFLPDGEHFLFYSLGTEDTKGVYIGSLSSPEIQRLFDADSFATYAPPGYLFFARQNLLMAQRFDLSSRQVQGDPAPLAAKILVNAGQPGSGALSISDTGTIAYRINANMQQFEWYSRPGERLSQLGDVDDAQPNYPRISPDGKTIALIRTADRNTKVWLMDAVRGTLRKFTTGGEGDLYPVWSPDGTRILFGSTRSGKPQIIEKQVDTGAETVVTQSPNFDFPCDVSPDGRYILFTDRDPKSGVSLWALPTFGDRKPFMVAAEALQAAARFSPSGAWIAYPATEGGRTQVYIQAFPGPGSSIQVSDGIGGFPEWGGDGRELFYVSESRRMMSVPVNVSGTKVEAGTPVPLFTLPPLDGYAVTRDGRKFLVNTTKADTPSVTLLLNWKAQ